MNVAYVCSRMTGVHKLPQIIPQTDLSVVVLAVLVRIQIDILAKVRKFYKCLHDSGRGERHQDFEAGYGSKIGWTCHICNLLPGCIKTHSKKLVNSILC